MPLETPGSVLPGSTEAGILHGVLPGDFLPSSLEKAALLRGQDGWISLRCPGFTGSCPAGLAEIRRPEDLPPGALLVRPAANRIAFTVPVPFGMDVHWMKEVAEGLLRGAAGLRVQSAGVVTVRGAWSADWIAAAAREDVEGEPGLRVVVARASATAFSAAAEGSWSVRAEAGDLSSPRDVAAALLGVHPLQWVRGLLLDLGSRRVEEFVKNAGSTLRAFDALREFWQGLGSRAEAGLWELARQGVQWGDLAAVLRTAVHDAADGKPLAAALAGAAAGLLPPAAVQAAFDLLGNMAGDTAGTPRGSGVLTAAQGLVRLLETAGVEPLLRALPAAVERASGGEAPDQWTSSRLEELFGTTAPRAVQDMLGRWSEAARKLAAPAAEAVAKQWELRLAAGISRRKGDTAAADATFRFTEQGLASAARVARGDLSPLFETGQGVLRLRRGLLTEVFARRAFIELHAPMLRARRKQRDLESFASAEASATEDGRLQIRYTAQAAGVITADLHTQTSLVFSAALSAAGGEVKRDHFSLSFTDRRRLDPSVIQAPYLRVLAAYGLEDVALPPAPCTAVLRLRLPGPAADAWMQTPAPGSPGYLPAMGRVAWAVQAMARQWLPALYLARVETYARPSAVHPLLAWSCSPPCSGPRKKDLSYDFMDPKVVDSVLQAGAALFRQRLEETWKFLHDSGRKQTAAYYEPADARYILANVRRQHRNFMSLLTADAFLVEAVLNVADCAREVGRLVRVAPKAAVTEMARFSREMAETFHRKLRRLYAGDEFLALGPLFFLTATGALTGDGRPQPDVAAVLTLEWEGGKASYANEAARQSL